MSDKGKRSSQKLRVCRALNKASQALIPELLRRFRQAIVNIQMYPPGNKQTRVSLDATYACISQILEKNGTFTLSEGDGELLANGRVLHLSGAEGTCSKEFVRLLNQNNVKSLTFRVGLTLDELTTFLEGFSRKFWKDDDRRVLTELLKTRDIHHIGINERVYVAVGDSDLILEQGKTALTKEQGAIDAISHTLEEAAEIGGIEGGESTRDEAKIAIAERLIERDPRLLLKLLEKEVSPRPQHEEEVSQGFSISEIKELINEMVQVYRDTKRADWSEDKKRTELARLRRILKRLLSIFKAKVGSLDLLHDLMGQDTEELFSGIKIDSRQTPKTTICDYTKELLQRDPVSLLDRKTSNDIPKLLRSLDIEGRHDLQDKLVQRLEEEISSEISEIRLKVASLFKDITKTLEALGERSILEHADRKILKQEEQEVNPDVYHRLGEILETRARNLLKEGEYKKTEEIVSLFRRHKEEGKRGFSGREKLANEALERMALSEMMQILFQDLRSEIHERQGKAYRIVVLLEQAAIGPLIGEIKIVENLRIRQLLASILKGIGEDATARLIHELQIEVSPRALMRLIEVADQFEPRELVIETIGSLLGHYDKGVRFKVVEVLQRLGGKRSGEILTSKMETEDEELKETMIIALGKIGYKEAIPQLLEIIKSRSIISREKTNEIQQAACSTLGRLGDKAALPGLLQVATPPPFFTLRRKKDTSVRVAAIRALGNFNGEEIRKVLLDLTRDKNRFIQDAAKATLKGYT